MLAGHDSKNNDEKASFNSCCKCAMKFEIDQQKTGFYRILDRKNVKGRFPKKVNTSDKLEMQMMTVDWQTLSNVNNRMQAIVEYLKQKRLQANKTK